MTCLVTGAAGFIGSHLAQRLLRDGHEVVGLDAFIPYYPRHLKEANLAGLRRQSGFEFYEADLRCDDLAPLVAGADRVYHLAAMAGLAKSWTDFDLYQSCNLTGTQRLLETVRGHANIQRFVYASTSSVYGRFSSGDESLPTQPISPYGVTKLAAESLCRAYSQEQGIPLTVLRYFSVYGPGQRPDMGYYRFIQAMLAGEPIVIYGDGLQARGNTYVSDCVEATITASLGLAGETYNIGGGESATVWEIVQKLEKFLGRRALIRRESARKGDQRSTFADTSKLQRHFGWQPRIGLDEGLALQVAWQRGAEQRRAA